MSRLDRFWWATAAIALAYFDAHAIAASYVLPAAIFTLLVAFAGRRALARTSGAVR